jgi:hypothetical protein
VIRHKASKEKDDDERERKQGRLHLQLHQGRLPLQPLLLPELRLLKSERAAPQWRGPISSPLRSG